MAGLPGRHRARAGQRELDLLRQGPRRPAVAGEAAAAAGRGRGHRPRPGRLPAAGRAAARACSRSSRAPSGIAPYFDLSFQHSSPTLLRRMRRFGGTDDFLALIERARALAPGAGLPHQRHPRLPGGDRGRRRRARALPHRGPPGRRRGLRLLRRGGHRGDRALPASSTRPRSTPASAGSPTSSRSSPPSAPRTGSASGSRCCSPRTSRPPRAPASGSGHAAHQDPDSDGTTTVSGVPDDAVPGQLVDADVVDTEGIDLVARALVLAPAPAGR